MRFSLSNPTCQHSSGWCKWGSICLRAEHFIQTDIKLESSGDSAKYRRGRHLTGQRRRMIIQRSVDELEAARDLLPKRQSEPDGSQLDGVVSHRVVEAFHKRQPDLKEDREDLFHFLWILTTVRMNTRKKKRVVLLWARPWSWRGPSAPGWMTRSAAPPARPAVWGSWSCSPAEGDTDLSAAAGAAAVCRMVMWRPACTHSEDSLRLSAGAHVGVVDLFEHHPGLVVFPHLTERRGRSHTSSGSIVKPFNPLSWVLISFFTHYSGLLLCFSAFWFD